MRTYRQLDQELSELRSHWFALNERQQQRLLNKLEATRKMWANEGADRVLVRIRCDDFDESGNCVYLGEYDLDVHTQLAAIRAWIRGEEYLPTILDLS